MNCGNKEKTEINIPEKLELEVCIHVGYDRHNFGDIRIRPEHAIKGDDCELGFATKHLGKVTIKVDTSNLDLNVDVRGILISKIEEQIKKENARHIKQTNYLESELSKLTAIEFKR